MKLILDGEQILDRESLHKHMETVLQFPEWYGGNLDALHDCLTELMEELDICVLHMESLERHLGDYAGKLLQVLRDAEAANPNILVRID